MLNNSKTLSSIEEYQAFIKKILNHHTYTMSVLSHEITTPLTLINSTLQLLEHDYPFLSKAPHWEQLFENIKTINNILTESKRCSEKMHLSYTKISVSIYLKKLLDNYQLLLPHSKTLTFEDNLSKNLVISCDKEKITQVLIILLNNALDSTLENGKIHLKASQSKNNIEIVIIDNGQGISYQDERKLFQLYHSTKIDGNGLGLFKALQILDAHGGSIDYYPNEPTGTCFRILLPF